MTYPYYNPKPYVPKGLSEIYDLLGSMILGAPTFIDKTGWFEDQNLQSQFLSLTEGFGLIKTKLGEENYATLIDLAARAKALFAEDQDDDNGKTDEGRRLLFQIEDIIEEVRLARVKAKLTDEEGEITGD